MPLVLHAGVERRAPVVDLVDGDAGRQRAGVEELRLSASLSWCSRRARVGWCWRSSRLRVVETPKRVASFSCYSQSPYAPLRAELAASSASTTPIRRVPDRAVELRRP